jgi:hypothetical protein
MHSNRFLIFSFCAVVAIVTSCSEDIKPTPFTFSKNFTGKSDKTWSLDKFVQRETGKKDQTVALDACESDDLYKFYANDEKLFEVYNGNKKCATDEDDLLVTYQWSYASANANLTMVAPHIFGNLLIPFIVRKVDSDEMQLEIFVNEKNTISYLLYFKVVNEN